MKLKSEKMKVVATEILKGEKEGKPWEMLKVYGNKSNGVQEQIVIPMELQNKVAKDKEITIIYEMGYKGKIYAKEIE